MRWREHRGSDAGYFFNTFRSDDTRLSYHSFQRIFKKDLQAIGITGRNNYNTQSFRRGGSQYYLRVKGKTVDEIVAWGGWDPEDELVIFGYLTKGAGINRNDFTRE